MDKLSIFTFITLLFVSFGVQAQETAPLITWNADINTDAHLNDWGDSLSYYFEDQDIQYEISNDDQFLYIACRIRDKAQQIQACLHGISVTVNADGKKKDGPKLIFPIPDKAALRGIPKEDKDPSDIRAKAINSVRAIFVEGFKDIVDGPVSLNNNFGVRAAVRLDSTDALCYEATIAIDQLQIGVEQSFALNLKINRITKHTYYRQPPRRYSRYGYGYGYGTQQQKTTALREEPGIWLLLKLTNP